jgi:hypothetical protein
LALEAEIMPLESIIDAITTERIAPFDDAWHALIVHDLEAVMGICLPCNR